MFFHSLAYFLSWVRNQIPSTKFTVFKSGNKVKENRMYQQLQKIYRRKFVAQFSGKFGQNIISPKKIITESHKERRKLANVEALLFKRSF